MNNENKILMNNSNDNNKKTNNTGSSSSLSKPSKKPNAKGYDPSLNKTVSKPKQKMNKSVAKKEIVAGVNSVSYGQGGRFAEKYLETDEGNQLLEEAAATSDGPTEAASKVVKEFTKKRLSRASMISAVAAVLPILLVLIPLVILFGKNPELGVGGEEENADFVELKSKIKEVKDEINSQYGVRIDGNLILAELVAYQESEKYSADSGDSDLSAIDKSTIELLAKYQIMTNTGGNCPSSTIRQIASNDDGGETNKKCDPSVESDSYSSSIERGSYDDDNSGGVNYWNLIDGTFIPDYYSSYVPPLKDGNNTTNRDNLIKNIVDDIYDYYLTLPPEDDESNDFCGTAGVGVVNASCPSITVSGYGTYDLETYIAGVLAAEPGATMVNDELGKYNAIIIRSFTLAHTNNCTKSITSSSNEQNFTNSTQYKKYADETAGIVMTKPDGKIIEAVYSLARASDCIPTNGKCKFKRCTDYAESVSSCPGKVTEFIVPYGTITYQGSDIHYGGSEPYLAKYLATKENYTYDKLLKAFYGDDMSLARLSSSAASSTSTTTTSSSDELCGNGDNSKYWWPSGSKQTETSGGKVYAKGDPESTTITNGFGCGGENAWRTTGCHGGLDIGVNCGSNIIAAKSGTVVNTSDGCPTYGSYGSSCGGGYGNYIILEHSDGNYTLYGHLSQNGVKVKQGDTVDQGQVIAASGSSGSSTGCHLHFEVRKGANTGDARDDPLNYVDPKNPRPKGGDFKHVKGDSVKQEVCLSLKASGYSNNGVAAVLGNMVAESSFDPNVVGDNGTSYGLCQWHEGRWESLKKFTSEWKTVPGQLQYLLHELKTSYSGLNESLISGSSSAYDLTNRYCTQFEVPADTESTCAARASSNASSMSSYVNNNCK